MQTESSQDLIEAIGQLGYSVTHPHPIGGGSVSSAWGVTTEHGEKLFIKTNFEPNGQDAFEAELLSLQRINEAAPLLSPKGIASGGLGTFGFYLIEEYIEMAYLSDSKQQATLGKRLAELHLHNASSEAPVTQFGFDRTTYCGATPLDNQWNTSWADFYANQRIRSVCNRIAESRGDPEMKRLGDAIASLVVPKLCGSAEIKPALIHGDLWAGNASANKETKQPVVFDPAAFYAHNEMELAMMTMFGGFTGACFDAYHQIIPKLEPYYKERQDLYLLYHQLNHTLLFGSGYRSSAIKNMQALLAKFRTDHTSTQ